MATDTVVILTTRVLYRRTPDCFINHSVQTY